jgi:hypothetical protein
MNFEAVHIHKTHRGSHENIIFLLIPILLFVAAILFISSKTNTGKVSGVSTGLTNSPEK